MGESKMNEKTVQWIKRAIGYCLGYFILAIGVRICIISDLGVSSVSLIPYVVSEILSVDLGICTTLVYAVLVALQYLILRKDFKLANLLQMFSTVIYSVFVSAASYLFLSVSTPDSYVMQLTFCAVGIFLVALGVLIYLNNNLLSLPVEGLTLVCAEHWNKPYPDMKIIVDSSMVATAAVIGLACTGGFIGIREGTLFSAVGVGLCLKFLRKMEKKLFGNRVAENQI